MYKKRSKIVHGTSEVNLEYADVSHFESIINQAIKRLIHIKINKESILKLLDEAVYSDVKKEELNRLVLDAVSKW